MLTGIGAWFTLPDPPSWAAFMALAGALLLGAVALGRGSRAAAALAWFSLFALVGCALIWARAESVAAPRLERAQAAAFSATIVKADRLAARDQVRLLLAPHDAPDLPPQLRVSIPLDKAPAGLEPGATLRLRAYLLPRRPWPCPAPMISPAPPGSPASVPPAVRWGRSRSRLRPAKAAGAHGCSARASTPPPHVQEQLPGSAGAVAAALATGDQGGIGEADAEAMRRSGLAHLLSVSGLHITAVVGAAMLLALRLLALSPWLALRFNLVLVAAGFAGLVAVAYTLFTGAEVPTIRSCAAALLVLAGIAMGRDAITLGWSRPAPSSSCSSGPNRPPAPSFQLSFAAVTAIVALHEHPRIKALLAPARGGAAAGIGRALLGLLLTGLASSLPSHQSPCSISTRPASTARSPHRRHSASPPS
jgi:competence protein ComEC